MTVSRWGRVTCSLREPVHTEIYTYIYVPFQGREVHIEPLKNLSVSEGEKHVIKRGNHQEDGTSQPSLSKQQIC